MEKQSPQKEQKKMDTERWSLSLTHTQSWEKLRWGDTRPKPFQTFPSFQPDIQFLFSLWKLLTEPLRIQGYCGVGRGLSGHH